jgi:hypothetical protein
LASCDIDLPVGSHANAHHHRGFWCSVRVHSAGTDQRGHLTWFYADCALLVAPTPGGATLLLVTCQWRPDLSYVEPVQVIGPVACLIGMG